MNTSASVPLMEALPWSASTVGGKCWLVCDSIETDGRFLLHTVASQALSSKERVFWLACGPWTCQLIAAAMKKLGCEAAAAYVRDSSSLQHPLHIRSVTVEMSTRLEGKERFDIERYTKELYHSIRSWLEIDETSYRNLIVVDDASALASLIGERLTYCFLLSLRAFAKRTKNCNLIILCSQDYEMDIKKEQDTSSVRAGGSRNADWVGAGGGSSDAPAYIPWERSLPELADDIVNVDPLTSGYSREAHGRLVFISQPIGDGKETISPIVMNYCCQDTSVSAIRLRGPATSR